MSHITGRLRAKAVTMPRVSIVWKTLPSCPRKLLGLNSTLYNGQTAIPAPETAPSTNRPIIKVGVVGITLKIAPHIVTLAFIIRNFLLPNLFEYPPVSDPNIAPTGIKVFPNVMNSKDSSPQSSISDTADCVMLKQANWYPTT